MLEYPFDADALLQNKRALKKQLSAQQGLIDKKIALLSGSTIGEIKPVLELFLLASGIRPTFFEGGYGRWYEELVYDDGSLAAFSPDVIYIHTGLHNIPELPLAGEDADRCAEKLDRAFAHFQTAWQAAEKFACPVIQNNFEYPRYRLMGNYEGVAPSGKIRFVRKLNERFADHAGTAANFYLNDLNYLSSFYGVEAFSDPAYYNAYKYAQITAAVPMLCHSVAAIIRSLFGRNKKALMLDLDNTLWGGVIGDDGVEGIHLGKESPAGMAHLELQQMVSELPGIGVVLGVCSKNEDAAARSGFTHPSSVLKANDFVHFSANWNPKSDNLRAAATALNIGADAMVFADDNPAERALVRESGLGVAVPELTDPERFAEQIANGGWFEVTALSDDDRARAGMYRLNAQRAEAQASFQNYGDYLKSLRMTAVIAPVSPPQIERVTQLANKTNQFNLTTRRYTEAEMTARAADARCIVLAGRLTDTFGDNGLVSALIAPVSDDGCDIELWIMSCRVFQREMEYAMFDALVAAAKARGIAAIRGHYAPTAKNAVVADLYEKLGFQKTAEDAAGSAWRYDIPEPYVPKNQAIEVLHDER